MLERVTSDRICGMLIQNADGSCRVITDELNVYHPVGMSFRGGHEAVRRGRREYVRTGTRAVEQNDISMRDGTPWTAARGVGYRRCDGGSRMTVRIE